MTAHHSRNQIKQYLKEQFNLPDEQIEGMIPSFLATLTGHMDKLEQALRQNDLEMLGRAGHTMKGALLNLGLHDCANIAYTIEQKGKAAETTADFGGLITALREKLGVLLH